MGNRVRKVAVLGTIAYVFYVYQGQGQTPQASAPPEAPPDSDQPESMPLWQNILLSIGAGLGIDALGAAAKRLLAPPEKLPGGKGGVAGEKAGIQAAEKAGAEAGEKAGAKAAEKAGVEAAEKAAVKGGAAADKAAVTAADAAMAAQKGTVVSADAAKAASTATNAAADTAKVATTAAEKVVVSAADDATKAGVKSIQLADDAAKAAKIAAKASRSAAAAAKVSTMLAKAGAMGPLGVLDLLLSAIVMTLQFTVKDFDAEAYKPIPPGFIGYTQLPEAARIVISQIPIAGSLLDLVGPLFQFGEKCPEGMYQETPGGLCFPKCPDGYTSDGAFLCYKQYPDFQNNGMLHTLTSVTKNILLDTGTIPGTCPPGYENDGGLCYPSCRGGFRGVGPMCWQDTVGIGAGTPVEPEPCPAGYNADSLLTCSTPVVSSTNPCPEGTWDVGGTCWGKKNLYIDRLEGGGNCRTWCDTNWDSSDGGLCHTRCDPIRIVTDIRQVDEIRVELKDRGLRTTGGASIGRLNNGGVCPGNKQRIDGLCYDSCPDGFEHTPGAPYTCRRIGEPLSYERGVGGSPGCGSKENIAGLCYGNIPSGYTRKVVGTLDQNCPAGANDFGVGCVRESSSRPGALKLVSELRQLAPDEFTT